MAITVKSYQKLIGPAADTYYDLWAAPTGPPAKAAIVKSIRIVNTDTQARTVNLRLVPYSGGVPAARMLAPVNMSMAANAGALYLDDKEITLGSGDSIQAKASAGNVIQCVLSGIERDV
jgi:hypothetical protein